MRPSGKMAVASHAQRLLFDAFQATGQYVHGLRTGQPRYTFFNYPAQSRLTPKQLAISGPCRTIQATPGTANGAEFSGNTPAIIVWSNCSWALFGLSLDGRNEGLDDMAPVFRKILLVLSLACVFMLISDPAYALRCGSKLVKDGMDESRVIELCGEPVSRRRMGYVLRPYILKRPAGILGHHSTRHVYSGFHEELMVTELVFNFGPRKLMRILRFEGGQLTSIRTAGYGYLKKDR